MGEQRVGTDRLSSDAINEMADKTSRATGLAPPSIDHIPGPMWVAFGGVVIATFIVSIAYRITAQEPANLAIDLSLFSQWFIWLDILNGVLIGYIWVAMAIMRRGLLRDLSALRPSLKLSDEEFNEDVRRIAAGSPVGVVAGGLVGATALCSMPILDPGFWTFERPEIVSLEMLFYGGRQAITGWLAGIAVVREIRATRGIAKLGGEHTRIDVLDLRPLQPFAHKGVRSAATWLVSSSLVSLFWLSEAPAISIGPIVFVVLFLATWVFLYPLIPLHNAIVAEKNRLLDRARDAIRAENDPLQTLSGDANPHFANLVAYYNLIENAREWPIETPTLLRLAAFATLGLGSWFGAAFVERLVASVIR